MVKYQKALGSSRGILAHQTLARFCMFPGRTPSQGLTEASEPQLPLMCPWGTASSEAGSWNASSSSLLWNGYQIPWRAAWFSQSNGGHRVDCDVAGAQAGWTGVCEVNISEQELSFGSQRLLSQALCASVMGLRLFFCLTEAVGHDSRITSWLGQKVSRHYLLAVMFPSTLFLNKSSSCGVVLPEGVQRTRERRPRSPNQKALLLFLLCTLPPPSPSLLLALPPTSFLHSSSPFFLLPFFPPVLDMLWIVYICYHDLKLFAAFPDL